jgi:hypothetical protein
MTTMYDDLWTFARVPPDLLVFAVEDGEEIQYNLPLKLRVKFIPRFVREI